jgi:hypothetical protein
MASPGARKPHFSRHDFTKTRTIAGPISRAPVDVSRLRKQKLFGTALAAIIENGIQLILNGRHDR